MFLAFIKNYFVKNKLKKVSVITKTITFSKSIQTVGLLIDESEFAEKEALISEIIANGISKNNLKVALYSDKLKEGQIYSKPYYSAIYSAKDLNWKAEITEANVNLFLDEKFDLFINYYAIENPILLLSTLKSKAKFKVGFSEIDSKFNDFIIKSDYKDYKIFTNELFKYLKILNKI